jgi:hypothetical protein
LGLLGIELGIMVGIEIVVGVEDEWIGLTGIVG